MAKQNATMCIGYRYVSIYVYSLHPLKKHISCTFFTVCSHILSRMHVLARALCRRGPAPCAPAVVEVEAFAIGGKCSVVCSHDRRLFLLVYFCSQCTMGSHGNEEGVRPRVDVLSASQRQSPVRDHIGHDSTYSRL